MGHSGNVYGDTSVSSTLYLGSGGGSGGNALDLSKNPKGITWVLLIRAHIIDGLLQPL